MYQTPTELFKVITSKTRRDGSLLGCVTQFVARVASPREQEQHLQSSGSVNSIMKPDSNFICKIYTKAIRAKVLIARATLA